MDEYDISIAFKKIENELISSMIRNMDRHRAEEDEKEINWSMWQTQQLESLVRYQQRNHKKYGTEFTSLNKQIETLIRMSEQNGGMEQEVKILQAVKNGFKISKPSGMLTGEFFKLNEKKLEALIKATKHDMEKAETAILRRADDQYRKIIFNAQVYANSGAGTYEKAVDMATKDMLAAGLTCVQYKNGAMHTLSDYADMAIRTASKRAYLQGEGEKRQEWGIATVIINKRGNPCPKCLPFVGKILIDDVWSGGKASDGSYPLMSSAIAAGLYHPRCKDGHTTYFPGISSADSTWTKEELKKIQQVNNQEAERQHANRQAEKFKRMSENSLDPNNKKSYRDKANTWEKAIEKNDGSAIIKSNTAEEGKELQEIGKIERAMYEGITEDIVTDDVILTDERAKHIIERRGQEFYDKYSPYFSEIVKNPDYIFKDKANTALVCKAFAEDGSYINIALRLMVSTDNPDFKNSIITAVLESEKRFKQRLRNNEPLYKKV